MKRRIVIIGGIVVLAGLLTTGFLFRDAISNLLQPAKTAQSPQPRGCSTETLEYVRKALVYPYDPETLSKARDSIVADDSYKKNLSCLYVVVNDDMQNGDLQAARSDMTVLLAVYKAGGTYDSALNGYVLNPEVLNHQLTQREEALKAIDVDTPDGLDSPYNEPPVEAEQ